jgi:hypothetical protein
VFGPCASQLVSAATLVLMAVHHQVFFYIGAVVLSASIVPIFGLLRSQFSKAAGPGEQVCVCVCVFLCLCLCLCLSVCLCMCACLSACVCLSVASSLSNVECDCMHAGVATSSGHLPLFHRGG